MKRVVYTALITGDCEPYKWKIEMRTNDKVQTISGSDWNGEEETFEQALQSATLAAQAHDAVRRHAASVERIPVLETTEREHVSVERLERIPTQDESHPHEQDPPKFLPGAPEPVSPHTSEWQKFWEDMGRTQLESD